MTTTLPGFAGIRSMDEVYSMDLMSDLSFVIFNDYEMANPQITERCTHVQRHFLAVSEKFPFRRVPLLKILLRATTVEEVEERVSAEDDFYSERELDRTAEAAEGKEVGW